MPDQSATDPATQTIARRRRGRWRDGFQEEAAPAPRAIGSPATCAPENAAAAGQYCRPAIPSAQPAELARSRSPDNRSASVSLRMPVVARLSQELQRFVDLFGGQLSSVDERHQQRLGRAAEHARNEVLQG